MRPPTIREMRAINLWLSDAATALNYWKAQAGQLGLLKTMRALDGATKALGYEVAERRTAFEAHRAKRAKSVRRRRA